MSDFERRAAPTPLGGSRSSSPIAPTGGRQSPGPPPQHVKRRSSLQVVLDTLTDVGSHVKAALSGADYEMTCANIPLDVRADPASRFVVIGGGPAGIHMAYLLKRAGYSDVTVLEASNNIGGRARTTSYKGTTTTTTGGGSSGGRQQHRSRVHIGAWHFRQCDLRNSALASLIDELGLSTSLRPITLYGRGSTGRSTFTANGAGSPVASAAVVAEPPVTAEGDDHGANKRLWHHRRGSSGAASPKEGGGGLSPRQSQAMEARRAALTKALQSYAALRKAVIGHSKGLLPRMGGGGVPRGGGADEDTQLLSDVYSLSFLGLMQKRRLDALLPCFELANTVAGYGPLSCMPAWQGLVFHAADSVEHVVRDGDLVPVYRGSMLVGGGVMGLLEAMVRRQAIRVVCGVTVTGIKRPPYDGGDGVCTYMKAAEAVVQLPFDVVLFSQNLGGVTSLLSDPSDEECMWSDEACDHTLAVSLLQPTPDLQRRVEAAGGFLHTAGSEAAVLRGLEAGQAEESRGRLQAIADLRCLLLSSASHGAEGTIEAEELPAPVLLAYQHLARGPKVGDEAGLRAALVGDVAELTGGGGDDESPEAAVQVLSTFPWKAFTHLSPLALERGFLHSMFQNQGRRRTVLLGSCPSAFDSVAHVLEYNDRVVEALALRPTGRR